MPLPIASRRPNTHGVAFAAGVVLVSFLAFRASHNRQVGDSRYAVLLAQNLIDHRDFDLSRYHLVDPGLSDYRLERVGDHLFYAFPPGSSILSVPFVAAMNAIGRKPLGPDGRYDWQREEDLNVLLAQLLMGVFVGVLFLTANLRLPTGWSLVAALGIGFGTQIWSTLSRGLWSDTWGILLVGLGVFLVVRAELNGRAVNGALLGVLAGAAYVCRPTNAIALLGFALYLCPRKRATLWFVMTSAVVGGAVLAYSRVNLGTLLPSYFRPNRIAFQAGLGPLAANLVSPSRGVLLYVPAIFAIGLLLARFWRHVQPKRLAVIATSLIVVYTIAISGFESSGGHSFGCRLLAGLVPWLALLAILSLDAARTGAASGEISRPGRLALGTACAFLCVAGVAINAVGATSRAAARWNVIPVNVDQQPGRIWQWRQPQFLASVLDPPGPYLRIPSTGVAMAGTAADAYLGRGWDYAGGGARWTDGGVATVRFLAAPASPGTLVLVLSPYLARGRLDAQRMTLKVNGHLLGEWELRGGELTTVSIPVRGTDILRENVIRLELPDAVSPHSAEPASGDRRQLGVAVQELRWSQDVSAPPPEGRSKQLEKQANVLPVHP